MLISEPDSELILLGNVNTMEQKHTSAHLQRAKGGPFKQKYYSFFETSNNGTDIQLIWRLTEARGSVFLLWLDLKRSVRVGVKLHFTLWELQT